MKGDRGMKAEELLNEVVMEWESVVNRVASVSLVEKMIVCGKAVIYVGVGMRRLRATLMQEGKSIRKLLMVRKICGMCIVDYGKT